MVELKNIECMRPHCHKLNAHFYRNYLIVLHWSLLYSS